MDYAAHAASDIDPFDRVGRAHDVDFLRQMWEDQSAQEVNETQAYLVVGSFGPSKRLPSFFSHVTFLTVLLSWAVSTSRQTTNTSPPFGES